MSQRLYLLNSVSYPAMSLLSLIQEEKDFMNLEEFSTMKRNASRRQTMAVIHQTMRTGKRLPMFAPHHQIQPPAKVEEAVE